MSESLDMDLLAIAMQFEKMSFNNKNIDNFIMTVEKTIENYSKIIDRKCESDLNLPNNNQMNNINEHNKADNILNRIFYQNCRGFGSKEKIIHPSMLACDYNIVILTETWLKSKHNTSAYFPDKFSVYRRDRESTRDNSYEIKNGGGLILAIRKYFSSEQIILCDDKDIEYICVKVDLGNRLLFIYTLYIPPKSSIEIYKKHVDLVRNIQYKTNDILLMIGDLNIPNVDWFYDIELGCYLPINVSMNAYLDILLELQAEGLFQINHIMNHANNVLDLVFVSDPKLSSIVEEVAPISSPIDPAHRPFAIQMELQYSILNQGQSDSWFYSFANTDFNDIMKKLSDVDFVNLLSNRSVDEQIDLFYDKMIEICDSSAKKIVVKNKKKYPWENNKKLINLKNRRRKAKKLLINAKNNDPQFDYEMICAEYDNVYKQIYEQHLNNIQSRVSSNPQEFWSFVKMKKSDNQLPSKMIFNDEVASNSASVSNMFAEYFGSVYTSESKSINDVNSLIDEKFNSNPGNIVINVYNVLKAINKLDIKKGRGPDIFPPLVFKMCASVMCIPICIILNNAYNSGNYPKKLKTSYVTPIHKTGPKMNVTNYRSVAVSSPLSKILELVLIDQWKNTINNNLSIHQHGFTKNRSTVTNLLTATTDFAASFDRGSQTDVINFDFEKAFDRVDFYIFLLKAFDFGLDAKSVRLMYSFLSNRENRVKIYNTLSEPYSPTSGVPAGCSLSAYLFNIFINDIELISDLGVRISLFADDLRIYKEINSPRDHEILQKAIDVVNEWCKKNQLFMNGKKVKVMTITRKTKPDIRTYHFDNDIIERVDEHKDLGVILDCKLSFEKHIQITVNRANSTLGCIKRFAYDFNLQTKKILYFSLVRSLLEYASSIWAPYLAKHKDLLERIQKNFTIWALKLKRDPTSYRYPHYEWRLEQLEIDTLTRRRAIIAMTFMYDLITGKLDAPTLRNHIIINEPIRTLRESSTDLIVINTFNRNYTMMQPLVRMATLFNKIKLEYEQSFELVNNRRHFINLMNNLDDDDICSY